MQFLKWSLVGVLLVLLGVACATNRAEKQRLQACNEQLKQMGQAIDTEDLILAARLTQNNVCGDKDPRVKKTRDELAYAGARRLQQYVSAKKFQAKAAFARGNYEQSVARWEEVLDLLPNDSYAQRNLKQVKRLVLLLRDAQAAKQKGQDIRAQEILEEALRLDPDSERLNEEIDQVQQDVLKNQGLSKKLGGLMRHIRSLLKEGKFKQALRAGEVARRSFPKNYRLRRLLREAREGRLGVRLEELLARGNKALAVGNSVKAIEVFRKALELVPENQAALEGIKKAGGNIDEMARVHFQKGLRFFGNDKFVRAIIEWRKVLRLQPNHPQAREYIDRAQAMLERLNQIMREVEEENPRAAPRPQ